jgi:uncharacterized RDD family membrane protein YckC
LTGKLDRINAFLDGVRGTRRAIVTPEGVTLEVEIASIGARLVAFALDLLFSMIGLVFVIVLVFALASSRTNPGVVYAVFLLGSFLIRNFYFIHFELTMQGATPGKRIVGLKVIDRDGAALEPGAVVARNLTREVETFLPLALALSLPHRGGTDLWTTLAYLGWLLAVSTLPLFNAERRRAGDLIGGTIVISVPKQPLLAELGQTQDRYRFSRSHLGAYGAFELQVLEEILRRPPSRETDAIMLDVCQKIATKIAWPSPAPVLDARVFLSEFYVAERAHLEREQLFGKYKADKTSAPTAE